MSYTVEALRIFDHYHFRVAQQDAEKAQRKAPSFAARRGPPARTTWWAEDYSVPVKIRDRELFA